MQLYADKATFTQGTDILHPDGLNGDKEGSHDVQDKAKHCEVMRLH